MEEFFGRYFWEEFFGRNFFGGFFWENFFGRIFWEDFFRRIFGRIVLRGILFGEFFVKLVCQDFVSIKKEGGGGQEI